MNQERGVAGALGRRLRAGEKLLSAWMVSGDPVLAELLVGEGFDTAVLDMQHGLYDFERAVQGIALVALAGAPAIVRIPVGDYATASRLLDAGAAAVIAPMISTAEDARAFVRHAKYLPEGERSWGPGRALPLTGLPPGRYLEEANGLQLAIPMIETRAALAGLDDILAVPGVDGVLVGPGDLSIALSGGTLDFASPDLDAALDDILAAARRAGKLAFMFCLDGQQAKTMLARGFDLCTVSLDTVMIRTAARAEREAAR